MNLSHRFFFARIKFSTKNAQHSAERKIIFYGLILAFWFKAVVFQRFDDLRDVLMAVGLGGDFEHDTVETILGLELVVIEPDDGSLRSGATDQVHPAVQR